MASTQRPRRVWPFQQVRKSLRKISGMRLWGEEHTHHHPVAYLDPPAGSPTESSGLSFSREGLEATADLQRQSPFFAKLPPEIRRLIYAEVWRCHLGDQMCLHVHSSSNGNHIQSTRCRVDPEDPRYEDAWDIQPFPGGTSQDSETPDWFWWAWCLRMRWGRHWQCQKDVMERWAEHGNPARSDWSPFLPVFLSSKLVYMEAIQSFFETVTLCFTASEDAHHFLVQKPHRYHESIRSLDFSFAHHKDHLYLYNIEAKHPRLAKCQGIGVGQEAWTALMGAMHENIPDLRSLRLLLGGNRLPAPETRLLSLFSGWKLAYVSIELSSLQPPKKYVLRNGETVSPDGELLNSSTAARSSMNG